MFGKQLDNKDTSVKLLTTEDIINHLHSEEDEKVLAASMGKRLREMIDGKNPVTDIKLVGNNIVLTLSDGSTLEMDASALILDKNAISGRYDEPTQSIVITLNDSTNFSIPVANLLPVNTDRTINGNGSSEPLSVAISTSKNNILHIDTDGTLLVDKQVPSDKTDNGITLVNDRMYLKVLDENDMHSDSTEGVPTQKSTKSYIDNKFTEKKFIKDTGFVTATTKKPTEAEAQGKVGAFRNGVMYYNGTDDPALTPTHTWWVDDKGAVTALVYEVSEDTSIELVGTLDDPKETEAMHTKGLSELIKTPNKMYEVFNNVSYTITDTPVTLLKTDVLNIQAGKGIEIDLQIPVRTHLHGEEDSWAGIYVTVNAKINGTWYCLGNTGFDEMAFSSRSISRYLKSTKYNIPKYLNLSDTYTIELEVVVSSYGKNEVIINGYHDINGIRQGEARNNIPEWAGRKNWSTLTVSEFEGENYND